MKTLNTWKTIERKADGGYREYIWKNETQARAYAAKSEHKTEVFSFPCYRYGGNLYPVTPGLLGRRS